MNIAVTWSGISLAVVADHLSGVALDGMRLAQVAQGLRAANAKVYDRRNASHTLHFTNTRAALSTILAAEQFMFDHQLALDAATIAADVTITLGTGGPVYTLHDATLVSVKGRHTGVTTIHDYELQGGLLSLA